MIKGAPRDGPLLWWRDRGRHDQRCPLRWAPLWWRNRRCHDQRGPSRWAPLWWRDRWRHDQRCPLRWAPLWWLNRRCHDQRGPSIWAPLWWLNRRLHDQRKLSGADAPQAKTGLSRGGESERTTVKTVFYTARTRSTVSAFTSHHRASKGRKDRRGWERGEKCFRSSN